MIGLQGLTAAFAEWDVCHHWSCCGMQEVVGYATVLHQLPQSQMPFQAYAIYAMDPPQVSLSLWVYLQPIDSICCCQLWCILSIFRLHCDWHFHLWGLNHCGLHYQRPLEHTHSRDMCILVIVWGLHQKCTQWLFPPLLWAGGSLKLLSCPPAIPVILWVIQPGSSIGSHQILMPSLHSGEGFSIPGLLPLNDMVNSKSVVGMKSGDSGVVMQYQVDEFASTWSMEHFVAHSIFILFLWAWCHQWPASYLNQGVRIIPFWTRQLQTLNRIWIPSSLTLPRH